MTNTLTISIIEDNNWYAELLKYHLELNPNYSIKCYEDGSSFLSHQKEAPDLICLDFNLPNSNGLELFKKIKEKFPNSEIIIISGQSDVGTAVELLKLGAYDYLVKDDETKERLWNTTLKIQEKNNLKAEVKELRKEIQSKYDTKNFIGDSPMIKKVFALMEKASKTNITVSISGETGTGKEVVAKSIHFNSPQKNKPFVAVNVAAIPKDLIESELFGHEKGAFTGANNKHIGKFERANGGTLFLDEIGEMDINLQAKLLRALQEKEITRIGGTSRIKLNTRIIVATHKNLLDEVKDGNFRQDLYYRLLGLPIELPALRERGKDIKLLADYFVESFCEENNISLKVISKEAYAKLIKYPFPGNVRELKALMELTVVMTDGPIINDGDISFRVAGGSLNELMVEEMTLKQYTAKIVQHFLDKNNKNVIKTANTLKVGKSTIYRMIQAQEVHL